MTRRTKFDGLEYDHRLYKSSICPFDASYVMPYADGTHRGHCPKCGPVTYVSMMETDVPIYREQVRKMDVVFGGPEWFKSIEPIPL